MDELWRRNLINGMGDPPRDTPKMIKLTCAVCHRYFEEELGVIIDRAGKVPCRLCGKKNIYDYGDFRDQFS